MGCLLPLGCFLAGFACALLVVYGLVRSATIAVLVKTRKSYAASKDYQSYVFGLLEAAPVKAHEISCLSLCTRRGTYNASQALLHKSSALG